MKKKTLFLLVLTIIVIAVSGISIVKSYNNKYVIEENVSFGGFICDTMTPFVITGEKKLVLEFEANFQKGRFGISIISPDNKVIYEKTGNNLSEKVELEVYKGIWQYNVKCYDEPIEKKIPAENGKYNIIGKVVNKK